MSWLTVCTDKKTSCREKCISMWWVKSETTSSSLFWVSDTLEDDWSAENIQDLTELQYTRSFQWQKESGKIISKVILWECVVLMRGKHDRLPLWLWRMVFMSLIGRQHHLQQLLGPRSRSTAARLACCVLSGRGLYDELIICPKESYDCDASLCVIVDEEAIAHAGLQGQRK
jgi:hypothetical protein